MSFRYEDSVIRLLRIKRKVREYNPESKEIEVFYEVEAINATPILSPIREAETTVQVSPGSADESD